MLLWDQPNSSRRQGKKQIASVQTIVGRDQDTARQVEKQRGEVEIRLGTRAPGHASRTSKAVDTGGTDERVGGQESGASDGRRKTAGMLPTG